MLSHRSIISNPLWPQYCSSIQSKTSIKNHFLGHIHLSGNSSNKNDICFKASLAARQNLVIKLIKFCFPSLFHCAWKQSWILCFCFGSLPKLWISSIYHPGDPNNTELSPACQTPVSNLCQVSIYIEFPYNSQTFKRNSQKLPFAKVPIWNS